MLVHFPPLQIRGFSLHSSTSTHDLPSRFKANPVLFQRKGAILKFSILDFSIISSLRWKRISNSMILRVQEIFDNLPARTREAARCIQANVLAATVIGRAFVYILAVRLQSSLLITIVAYALISAHHVLTDSVRANSAGPRTLVYILARLLVRTQLVAGWTLTLEASLRIDAGAPSAQTRCLLAFIYIWNSKWMIR